MQSIRLPRRHRNSFSTVYPSPPGHTFTTNVQNRTHLPLTGGSSFDSIRLVPRSQTEVNQMEFSALSKADKCPEEAQLRRGPVIELPSSEAVPASAVASLL